jgi:uncharacterized SAM-binding protein YcdF (DUF218 family)
MIEANVVVLGPVRLGNNIKVIAGAVVVHDAVDNDVLGSVPATQSRARFLVMHMSLPDLFPRPRRTPRTARLRALRLIGLLTLAAFVIQVSIDTYLPAIGQWLAMPETVELIPVDAIVVNGGSPVRTLYGAELYRRGLAPEIWHTGYARGETPITASIMESGVPPQAFRYLVTTSTWSDGTEIAAMIRARKLHSVIIVTDWWHSRRALCATKQQLQGYDVAISFAPSPAPAGPSNWWQNMWTGRSVVSELMKLGYYAMAYGMPPRNC